MMKYKSKILGVNNVCAKEDILLLLRDNVIYFNDKAVYNSDLEVHYLVISSEYSYIVCAGEILRSVVFDQNGTKLVEGEFDLQKIHSNSLYVDFYGLGKKISLNKEVMWELKESFFQPYIHNDRFYCKKDSYYNLFCIDDKTGQELWTYCSFPKYNYQREETIGVFREEKNNMSNIIVEHNGLLWIVLATGVLIALDVETGKEKYVLVKPVNYKGEYNYSYTRYAKFDNVTNQLFGSYGNQYWELDLADPELTFLCYDLSQNMKEHEIDSITCKAWDGKDRIFFGDTGDNYKIGVFSRSQKTITWTYAIQDLIADSWMSIRQLEYGAGRLYVRDKFNVLHIFEDEVEDI